MEHIKKTNILTEETHLVMTNVLNKINVKQRIRVSERKEQQIVNGVIIKTKFLHENDMLDEENLLVITEI